MIMRGEKNYPRELDQTIVQCSDGLHVQMVGRLIQNQDVGTGNHHFGKKAANLLTTGKYADTFHTILTREEHTSKETTYISGILDLRILCQPVCNRKIVIEFLSIVFGEISLGGSDSPFVITFIRFHFSSDDLEESSDRLLIGTNESNLVLTSKSERNVIQNLHAINGFGKIFDHENFISNFTVWTEVDVGIFTAGRTHVIQLDFLKGSLTGGCLLGFGSVGTESGNKFLQFLDLLLFLFVGFLHLLDQQLAGLIPEVIVTCVQLDFAIVDICSLCTNLVQEVTVMGNYDNGIVKVDQELLKPLNSRKVQMVGGLVKKQDIRISEKGLCKKNLDLHASCKVSHLRIVEFRVNSKTVQKGSSVRLCFPSVHFCKFALQLAGADSVLIGEVFFGIDGFLLFHDLVETKVTHDNGIKNRISIIFKVVLLQERETLSRCDHDVTLSRLKLAGKDLQESRLSCAVGTDQAVTVPLCKFDIYIFEKSFLSNSQSNIVC